MKTFFSILLFIAIQLTATNAISQNCKSFLLLQNSKKIVMTIYNKKGNEDGKQTWRVSNVKSSGTTTTSTVKSEFKDKNGAVISSAVNEVKCTGDNLQMNMKMLLNEAQLKQMGNAKVTAKGEFIDYPVVINDGDLLKDGKLEMDIVTEKGIEMNISLEITNRKADGKETITSAAGTWECIKISSSQKLISRVAGIGIPIKMNVTEWYAPGVGVVKTQSKYGSTLITSIQ